MRYGTLYNTVNVFFTFLFLSFVVVANGLTAQEVCLVGFANLVRELL